MTVPESQFAARWWHMLGDGRMQCDLCPRDCKLHEGQRGLCFVRKREGEQMLLTTYGRSSGFCVDPVEKKPLFHFLPGSAILSFGTAGCNLACKFCQNWDISKSREMDTLMDRASPDAIAAAAADMGCRSVAFTYNDPVIFAEYAMDVADACHARGIRTVAVTAGYVSPEPRREFFAKMDAANVDLKAFTDDFYVKLTGAHLDPVLDTLQYLRHETDCWLEITTLLIPGKNDSRRGNRRAHEVGGEGARARTCRCTSARSTRTGRCPTSRPRRTRRCSAPATSGSATACATSTPATCTTWPAAPPPARPATRR